MLTAWCMIQTLHEKRTVSFASPTKQPQSSEEGVGFVSSVRFSLFLSRGSGIGGLGVFFYLLSR